MAKWIAIAQCWRLSPAKPVLGHTAESRHCGRPTSCQKYGARRRGEEHEWERFAIHHRIFISFAIEDKFARDNLVFQAKQNHTPFEFTDMSVKQPWDSSWKTNCRARIKGCDGVIAFLSKNTLTADGARWEIKCAIDEGIPLLPVYIHDDGCAVPSEVAGKRIYHWKWENIANFLDRL